MTLPIGAVGHAAAAVSDMSRHASQVPAQQPFAEVLGERGAGPPAPTTTGERAGPAHPRPAPPSEGPPGVRRALVDLVEGQRRLDQVVKAAMSGRDFTVQELIGIQATVFRYSQEMEVASRLIDRLTGTIKSTLQTQV
jgi:hypothetical protein